MSDLHQGDTYIHASYTFAYTRLYQFTYLPTYLYTKQTGVLDAPNGLTATASPAAPFVVSGQTAGAPIPLTVATDQAAFGGEYRRLLPHAYMCTYINTHIHTYIHTYQPIYLRTYLHTVPMLAKSDLRRVRRRLVERKTQAIPVRTHTLPTYLLTYLLTYLSTSILHIHLPTYLHTHLPIHLHTYIHLPTYIHTYIYTYICTYIHTYIHT